MKIYKTTKQCPECGYVMQAAFIPKETATVQEEMQGSLMTQTLSCGLTECLRKNNISTEAA